MCLNLFNKSLDKMFLTYAKSDKKTIALPEAEFSGLVIKAAEYCTKKQLANIVLIGDDQKIKNTFLKTNFDAMTILTPKTYPRTEEFAKKLYDMRKDKGLTLKEARELMLYPVYFATMLLEEGIVDGVVGGAATKTSDMLRPALQIIKTREGVSTVSSSMIMLGGKKIGDKGVFVLGDCALNVNPNASQLTEIALSTIKTAQQLTKLTPRVAMLSYSTQDSASGESVETVKEATKNLKAALPEILIEGELQADSALDKTVARVKVRNPLWKADANILIFPELNSANISYKLLKISGGMKAIGPIMQGFEKPVNDLSRGANLKEIILTIAITAIQAQELSLEEQKQKKIERKLKEKEEKKEAKLLKQEKAKEKQILKRQTRLELKAQKQLEKEVKEQETQVLDKEPLNFNPEKELEEEAGSTPNIKLEVELVPTTEKEEEKNESAKKD